MLLNLTLITTRSPDWDGMITRTAISLCRRYMFYTGQFILSCGGNIGRG